MTGVAGEERSGPLLEPALLARLEALQLGTRRRLAGHFAGEHRSPRRGSSLDFADYRSYVPGDDFRRIDYFLYARLDVLAVKLFEAEDDLHLRLLLDTSASMAGGKLLATQRLAAALGFLALIRRDPVTIHTFPLDRPAPRFAGRGAVGALLDHLGSLEASGTTPFAAAVAALLARPGPQALTVVLSDLLTPEWETALPRLPARGGDAVVVHVLARDDLVPDLLGDLELIDREGTGRLAVSIGPDTATRYRRRAEAWLDDVAARCRQAGVGYVRFLDDDDLEATLLGSWRRAGVLR